MGIDLIRDAPIGIWLRYTSWGRKALPYRDELETFQCPHRYQEELRRSAAAAAAAAASGPAPDNATTAGSDRTLANGTSQNAHSDVKQEKEASKPVGEIAAGARAPAPARRPTYGSLQRRTTVMSLVNESLAPPPGALSGALTLADDLVEQPTGLSTAVTTPGLEAPSSLEAANLVRKPSRLPSRLPELEPSRAPPDTVIVDWYGPDDPENPWNWSTGKRAFVAFVILFLTFNVYAGSSMITSSFPIIMQRYNVGIIEVTTSLAVYVFAYGFGALVFSPLSEVPKLGRNVFYIYPMMAFVLLQLGLCFVDNFYGICILRFLTGFMGAPCLATGGASLQDAFPPSQLGVLLSMWALSAFAAPSTAPTMGNYAAVYMNSWRWPMWIMLIQVGLSTVLLAFLPETSHEYILMHRAKRLRHLTGNKNIRSRAEIAQANMTVGKIVTKAIVRPTEIFLKDPAVTYIHCYVAFVYGCYYLFFEAYPLVFGGIYNFSFQVEALGYLAFIVGGLIAFTTYVTYLAVRIGPIFARGQAPLPEQWLDPLLVSSVIAPMGIFLFAWTSRHAVHWIAPLFGVAIFGGANFVSLQCLFTYLLSVYPHYGASLLAGNDFLRSSVAAGLLPAGHPMFVKMGIAGGTSFLGGLLIVGTAGAYFIRFFGARLRARSKFLDE